MRHRPAEGPGPGHVCMPPPLEEKEEQGEVGVVDCLCRGCCVLTRSRLTHRRNSSIQNRHRRHQQQLSPRTITTVVEEDGAVVAVLVVVVVLVVII